MSKIRIRLVHTPDSIQRQSVSEFMAYIPLLVKLPVCTRMSPWGKKALRKFLFRKLCVSDMCTIRTDLGKKAELGSETFVLTEVARGVVEVSDRLLANSFRVNEGLRFSSKGWRSVTLGVTLSPVLSELAL